MENNLAVEVGGKIVEAKAFRGIACDDPIKVEDVATMPVNQAQAPVLAPIEVGKDIYIWEMGKGFMLSKREWVIAETFLKVRNYAECCRAVNKECNCNLSVMTVRRWLERPHIKGWLKEQMDERGLMAGWTEGRWLKVVTDHIQGIKRLASGDLYAMKLIAQVKGFGDSGDRVMLAQQINFMERAV